MKTLSVRDAISWPALLLCAALLGAAAGAVQAAESDMQTPYTQEWRVLPGESLNSLAKLFYPKSSAMQQRFVSQTLALNREQLPELKAGTAFEQETRITIPNLHDLSKQAAGRPMTHKHRAGVKASAPAMTESPAPEPTTAAPEKTAAAGAGLAADYEAMAQRNEARQKELDKLNDRLKSLEQSSKTIKESLDKDNQAMQGAVADAQQSSQAAPSATAPAAADDAGGKKLKRVQAPPPASVEAPDELGLPILLGVGLAVLLVAFGAYRWLRGKK